MKINLLELQANDPEALRQFYMDVLGLPVTISDGTLSIQVGRSQLVFRQSQDSTVQAYHFAFNIPEKRFEEAKAWISQRVPLMKRSTGEDSFHFANWNAHACYFNDAAGNIVEFIARHALTDDSDLPFDERSILCISEIGIATDDVEATVRSLQAQGLPVYDGEGSDTFTAVGDEHGLFIVIKRGRTWFPDSGVPADFVPLKVVVSTNADATATLSGPPYQFG